MATTKLGAALGAMAGETNDGPPPWRRFERETEREKFWWVATYGGCWPQWVVVGNGRR